MDTSEYIKEIHDLSEFLSNSNDVDSIEYHIDELTRVKKEFMNKYNGLKLIKKALNWDAKIELIKWETINDDVAGEAFLSNDIEFKIDDLSLTLDTFLYQTPIGELEIIMRINDTEYTASSIVTFVTSHRVTWIATFLTPLKRINTS